MYGNMKENLRKETCEFLSCYRIYKWGAGLVKFNPRLKTATGEIWVNAFLNDDLVKKGSGSRNLTEDNINDAVTLIEEAVKYVGTYPGCGKEYESILRHCFLDELKYTSAEVMALMEREGFYNSLRGYNYKKTKAIEAASLALWGCSVEQ